MQLRQAGMPRQGCPAGGCWARAGGDASPAGLEHVARGRDLAAHVVPGVPPADTPTPLCSAL